jgi:hypothetical protein
MRAKRRQRARVWVRDHLSASSSPGPGVRSPQTHDADDHFHELLAQESSARLRDRDAAEWAAYERRHGTPHPSRVRAQIERQAAEDTARAPRFSTPTVAERGQAGRGRSLLPAQNTGPGWDDDDPDMMEPPRMVDLGNWRTGRKW